MKPSMKAVASALQVAGFASQGWCDECGAKGKVIRVVRQFASIECVDELCQGCVDKRQAAAKAAR